MGIVSRAELREKVCGYLTGNEDHGLDAGVAACPAGAVASRHAHVGTAELPAPVAGRDACGEELTGAGVPEIREGPVTDCSPLEDLSRLPVTEVVRLRAIEDEGVGPGSKRAWYGSASGKRSRRDGAIRRARPLFASVRTPP